MSDKQVPLKALEKERATPANVIASEAKQSTSERVVPLRALEKERAKYKEKINKLQEELTMATDELEMAVQANKEIKEEKSNDFLSEFAELIKNPIYSDAGDYLEEIKTYATDNNCNLKVAYNSLYAERKYDEIKRKAEYDMAKAEMTRPRAEVPTGISGGSAVVKDERAKLDKDHLLAAEKYGMTIEEYLRYM